MIPSNKRVTACISSQVGCSLDCNFCATSKIKKMRNLESYKIFDQIMLLNKESINHFSSHITNIVFMGMGEPLLNYKNVIESMIRLLVILELEFHIKNNSINFGISKMIKRWLTTTLNLI